MSPPRIVPGQPYRRRALHAEYGGSYQSGISSSVRAPVVFLFTGESGLQHGYRDGWQDDSTYLYTGEGQSGDIIFTRGNRAIRDHRDDGRRLYLFSRETRRSGYVAFIGEMTYTGHRLIPAVPDRLGNPRTAIVFELAPTASGEAVDPEPEQYDDQLPPSDPLETQLSAFNHAGYVAEDAPTYLPAPPPQSRPDSRASRATRTFVLRRAKGHCEGCGLEAPFLRTDGSPYLEPHRVDLGSDQELTGPDLVVALCPNCHRRTHFGEDGQIYNEQLIARLTTVKPSP